MNCGGCGQRCPEGASFCGACGGPLVVACPQCERENPAGNRFCQHCGVELLPAASSEEASATEPHGSRPAERRHLTVMFVDLVGSTALAETVDVEDMRALLRQFHAHCERLVGEHGGVIANYVGDGVLAFFGYPVAHEDDAVQAVRAGVAIVEGMPSLAARSGIARLAARVGLHTGVTVVGETGAGSARLAADAVGETPNIAARLQGLAGSDEVVISSATNALVEGYFHLESLGQPQLKGVSRPIGAFVVRGSTAVRTRLDAAAQRGFTPLVGRERELALLETAWEEVVGGQGRVVILRGEPGIGKSRLLHELRQHIDGQAVVVELTCSPRHSSSGLHPLVEHLSRAVRAESARDDDDLLDSVEHLVERSSGNPRIAVPVVAELLGVPYEHRYARLEGSPELRKRQTLETVTGLLLGLREENPVVLLCEDLQWMDPTTLELIDEVVDHRPRARLLTVLTHRPDFVPPWPDHAHIERLSLRRLAPEAAEQIIDVLSGRHDIPREVIAQIAHRTEGVPLFLEELTQTVLTLPAEALDAGADTDVQHVVPATLRDSIMARLDRLGPSVDLAQFMAAVGREVSYAFLHAAWAAQGLALDTALHDLVDAGLVYQRGTGNRAVFVFKHALVQDVAYDSLLRTIRTEHHRRIAETLLDRFPDEVAAAPETVAQHCAGGGMTEQAIALWRRAGERELARYSPAEGITHLRCALEHLATLPPDTATRREELAVLTAIGPPLAATRGYGSSDVEQVYARAQELSAEVDDPRLQFVALYGVYRTRLLRAEYREAEEVATTLQVEAERSGSTAFRIAAHRALGAVLVYRGERLDDALELLDAGASIEGAGAPDLATCELLRDVADPGITCRAYAAWAHWLRGDAETASSVSNAAIRRAEQLRHPFTISLARCFDLWLRQFNGEIDTLLVRAEVALEEITTQGFAFWHGWALALRGWAKAQKGEVAEGVAEMEEGLVAWQATGSLLGRTYLLALLAEGLLLAGRTSEAADLVEEARLVAVETGERFWIARLEQLAARSQGAR